MSIYAVGDIQGCLGALKSILRRVHFDPDHDVLWCVGDLVNRGPESLETLRFLKALGDACICVLGNHDLNLLELAAGGTRYKSSTLTSVLEAPDRDELIDWLRQRPMLHHDEILGWAMVHASLHPDWSLKKAKKRAAEVEKKLCGKKWKKFCLTMHNTRFPDREPPKGDKRKHLFSAAVLTRGRYCTSDGQFNWSVSSGESRNRRDKPWFAFHRLAWQRDCKLIYGHWAAKGLVLNQPHVLGLDSGCVWGGSLTLAQLGTRGRYAIAASYECKGCRKPSRRRKKR
jgi:bis(5'-nucleosyl)-tetraphosphatase (symmetrical)